jgi:hypothetical protein
LPEGLAEDESVLESSAVILKACKAEPRGLVSSSKPSRFEAGGVESRLSNRDLR